MPVTVQLKLPPARAAAPPDTRKAAAGCTARGLRKIDHLGGLITPEDSQHSPLLQAARRLQARFGLSESTATVTAISAGLAMREVHS
jgi:hypothetical protein